MQHSHRELAPDRGGGRGRGITLPVFLRQGLEVLLVEVLVAGRPQDLLRQVPDDGGGSGEGRSAEGGEPLPLLRLQAPPGGERPHGPGRSMSGPPSRSEFTHVCVCVCRGGLYTLNCGFTVLVI